MNIKVIFSGDEKASRLFIKTHLEKFTPVKKVYIGIFIAALIATIAFFVFDKNSQGLFISFLVCVVVPFFYMSQRNSLIDKSINKRATYDQEVVFETNQIVHSFAATQRSYQYDQIVKFVEIVEYIYLYIDASQAIIIPKLQIPKEEMDKLISHLHQKIDEKKYKYYKIKK